MAMHRSSLQLGADPNMPVDGMFVAVEAYRAPSRFRKNSSQIVFAQMLTVIKAAAGDEKTLAEQTALYRMSARELQEAAKHFLLLQLLNSDARGNRLLGLPDDATPAELKDHKRWLLKWLHPDRNPSTWEQKLFHRVSDFQQESHTILRSTLESNHRKRGTGKSRQAWKLASNRHRDASPPRIFLRTLRLLVAGALCATAAALIVFLISGGIGRQFVVVADWLN
jgi:hypothetical protein